MKRDNIFNIVTVFRDTRSLVGTATYSVALFLLLLLLALALLARLLRVERLDVLRRGESVREVDDGGQAVLVEEFRHGATLEVHVDCDDGASCDDVRVLVVEN